MTDGRTIGGWEPQERPWIVCAANRYGELVIAGARHHDNVMRGITSKIGGGPGITDRKDDISIPAGWKEGWDILRKDTKEQEEQGFIDQFGRFYNRKEAMLVAIANGQLERQRNGEDCEYLAGNILCSEDLY